MERTYIGASAHGDYAAQNWFTQPDARRQVGLVIAITTAVTTSPLFL
jgi:hypothetical protein